MAVPSTYQLSVPILIPGLTNLVDKTISDNNHKYNIIKHIASGTYGDVFLSINELNELVALKFMLDEQDAIRERECLSYIKDYCREYLLCYITNFVYTFNGIKTFVIVTKYLEGYITLQEFIDDYKVSQEHHNEIANRITNAVDLIHEHNLAHGDLYERNILINPKTLDIKLIDFGKCITDPKNIRNLIRRDREDLETILYMLQGTIE